MLKKIITGRNFAISFIVTIILFLVAYYAEEYYNFEILQVILAISFFLSFAITIILLVWVVFRTFRTSFKHLVEETFCPRCDSLDVDEAVHGFVGVDFNFAKFLCNDCGHAGNVFPHREKPKNH
tara:strand:+ start:1710 stop:2081 length:372 start_codon:yes stop_codon:yes gene_type:complete